MKAWRRSGSSAHPARVLPQPGYVSLSEAAGTLTIFAEEPVTMPAGTVMEWEIKRTGYLWSQRVAWGTNGGGPPFSDENPDQWPSSSLTARARFVQGEGASAWVESPPLSGGRV